MEKEPYASSGLSDTTMPDEGHASSEVPPKPSLALHARNVARSSTLLFFCLSMFALLCAMAALEFRVRSKLLVFVLALPITLFAISLLSWLAIAALCFLRYSLMTLMLVVLFGATFVTFIVASESPEVKTVGCFGLVALGVMVAFGIASSDPEDRRRSQ
jgi:cation transport ATPase